MQRFIPPSMRQRFIQFYRFLPVQLVLLHFRKYQMILIFWIILFAVITNQFATNFGAISLFLSPEYLGRISVTSFFLLGGSTAIFAMSWHITTFIIHSKRIPFLGATRHSFLKYCINNSTIPLTYLVVFGILAFRYLAHTETISTGRVLSMLGGFYSGYLLLLLVSFAYFFRVDRNILKILLGSIANPSIIREFIPYDNMDREFDLVRAESYLNSVFQVKRIQTPYTYNHRFLTAVLRRHHRNAIFAVFIAVAALLTLGIFMDNPVLRIPAGSGFLLLFAVLMTLVGAFKYFLRSWEIIGWLLVFTVVSLLVKYHIFELGSIPYGLQQKQDSVLVYNYQQLKNVFTDSIYERDRNLELQRLDRWEQKELFRDGNRKPPLVIISVSGGGSRSAYWTFRCLQYADSLTGGNLFKHTILITGASGGMIGAAQWRAVHLAYLQERLANPYDSVYQQQLGKDLLNAVIFSLASVDIISPFNKITFAGQRYRKDRGYAFDRELVANTTGLLGHNLDYYQKDEYNTTSPLFLLQATIINDGRKLLMSTQPVSYLTRSASSLKQKMPVIDGVDFVQYFKDYQPMNLHFATALRMNATFPVVLPKVELPTNPVMSIMDAGLRDNFGLENSMRYLATFDEWITRNCSEVILLQIRDTRQHDPYPSGGSPTLMNRITSPIFAIQNKWGAFQTFHQEYVLDYALQSFPEGFMKKVTLQYIPGDKEKTAALNFHLTGNEKQDLYQSVHNPNNQEAFDTLKAVFSRK